jgi:hypothetical protein
MRRNDIYDLCHRIRSLLCQKVHDIMYKGGEKRSWGQHRYLCVDGVYGNGSNRPAFILILRKGKITASA